MEKNPYWIMEKDKSSVLHLVPEYDKLSESESESK